MKLVLMIVSMFLITTGYVYSQADSVYIKVDNEYSSDFKSSKKYNYLDHSQFERKTLFKYSQQIGNLQFNVNDRLSVEQKLSPSLSLEVGWLLPRFRITGVYTQLRYYPGKRLKAPESKYKTNNFSGNYIGLGATKGFDLRGPNEFIFGYITNYIGESFNVSFGRQQKYGRWGFVDLGANLEYFTSSESLQLSLKMNTGLAFGKSKSVDGSSGLNRYDEFKEDYKAEQGILKISDPVLLLGQNLSTIGFNLEYERYILKNLSLNSSINFLSFDQVLPQFVGSAEADGYSVSLGFQLRYYYSQAKRLRQGKNSQSFTGPFIALGVNDLYQWGKYNNTYSDGRPSVSETDSGFDKSRIQLMWGTQERIGKRGFFKLAIGAEYDTQFGGIELVTRGSIGLIIGK